MNTDTATPARPRAIGFIHFHGRDLLVVGHQGIHYTAAKPLSDTCELDWRSTKHTLSTDENADFYGTTRLSPPDIEGSGGTSTPRAKLYVRLDRVHMFITRINTAHIRAKGKPATADFILALQHEWADALYAYETHGIAVKPGRQGSKADELLKWAKLRNQLGSAEDRRRIDQLLHDELAALGLPVNTLDDAQLLLPLPERGDPLAGWDEARAPDHLRFAAQGA